LDCPSGQRHTSEELHQRILNIGAAFKDLGLKKGEVVCFVCPNSDYYAIGLLGMITAGRVFTGCSEKSSYREFWSNVLEFRINWTYLTISGEILNAAEDTGVRYMVCAENTLDVVKKVADKLDQIKVI